jgi:hypothetical protein
MVEDRVTEIRFRVGDHLTVSRLCLYLNGISTKLVRYYGHYRLQLKKVTVPLKSNCYVPIYKLVAVKLAIREAPSDRKAKSYYSRDCIRSCGEETFGFHTSLCLNEEQTRSKKKKNKHLVRNSSLLGFDASTTGTCSED